MNTLSRTFDIVQNLLAVTVRLALELSMVVTMLSFLVLTPELETVCSSIAVENLNPMLLPVKIRYFTSIGELIVRISIIYRPNMSD